MTPQSNFWVPNYQDLFQLKGGELAREARLLVRKDTCANCFKARCCHCLPWEEEFDFSFEGEVTTGKMEGGCCARAGPDCCYKKEFTIPVARRKIVASHHRPCCSGQTVVDIKLDDMQAGQVIRELTGGCCYYCTPFSCADEVHSSLSGFDHERKNVFYSPRIVQSCWCCTDKTGDVSTIDHVNSNHWIQMHKGLPGNEGPKNFMSTVSSKDPYGYIDVETKTQKCCLCFANYLIYEEDKNKESLGYVARYKTTLKNSNERVSIEADDALNIAALTAVYFGPTDMCLNLYCFNWGFFYPQDLTVTAPQFFQNS